jgi:hypothetical protein
MVVSMLSCPATYCNVNGSVYSPGLGQKRVPQAMQASVGVGRDFGSHSCDLRLQHPASKWRGTVPGAREYVIAARVPQERFEHPFHFWIDDELSFARPPFLQTLNSVTISHLKLREVSNTNGSAGPVTGFDAVLQQEHQIFPAIDLNIAPQWEVNFGLGVPHRRNRPPDCEDDSGL